MCIRDRIMNFHTSIPVQLLQNILLSLCFHNSPLFPMLCYITCSYSIRFTAIFYKSIIKNSSTKSQIFLISSPKEYLHIVLNGLFTKNLLYHIVSKFFSAKFINNPLIVHRSWSCAKPLITYPYITKLPDINTNTVFIP